MDNEDSVTGEVMALERRYWSAIKDKDSETAASLSLDPCLVVGAQGIGELDRPTLRRMLQGAAYTLKAFSFDDVRVRRVSDDVVSVAYKVNEDLTVDGSDLSLVAYDSSVWVRHNGKWRCALHTESIAGDPFGRDKA